MNEISLKPKNWPKYPPNQKNDINKSQNLKNDRNTSQKQNKFTKIPLKQKKNEQNIGGFHYLLL